MNTTGMEIISEMSKEELIRELQERQRAELEKEEIMQLRSYVAQYRIKEARQRILAEAGLKAGVLGFVVAEDDE